MKHSGLLNVTGRAYSAVANPLPLLPPCPVSLWKLRPRELQNEYGARAPRVATNEDVNALIGDGRPSLAPRESRVVQDAWFSAALEELAQVCGAFLGATASQPTDTSSTGTRVRVGMHVGDALDFCDALLAVPPMAGAAGSDAAPSSPIPPVAFQQATIQPLELRDNVFGAWDPAFDVIKCSTLVNELGG